jgi:hypothetical protein
MSSQCHSDLGSFGQSQYVFHINTMVTHGIFNLGVPKQKLVTDGLP